MFNCELKYNNYPSYLNATFQLHISESEFLLVGLGKQIRKEMKKEKLNEVLDSVESETERFLLKLKECRIRQKKDIEKFGYIYSNKENAAIKRAALDLKNQLTRVTQSVIY